MLKLVIVDDERLVRELISLCVDWNELGYEIVGMSASAEEGLEMVRKLKPDVLFTDVRMPGQTGLDLGRVVLAEFPLLKVVVISGYDEFSYVNEGLKMGIFDYVLKPIDADVLSEMAIKLRDQIYAERKHQEEFRQYKDILEKNYTSIKERSIGRLVTSKNVDMVAENLKFFNIELADDCFQAAIIEYKADEEFEQENDLLRSIQVRKAVDDYFKDCPGVLIFESRFQRVDLINNQLGIDFYQMLCGFVESFLKKNKMSIRIGVGEFYQDIRQLPISYREARHVLRQYFQPGKGYCHKYSDLLTMQNTDTYIHESPWKNLGYYLNQGMVTEAENEISRSFKGMQESQMQRTEITFVCMSYIIEIFSAASNLKMKQEALEHYRQEAMTRLMDNYRLADMHDFIINLTEQIFAVYRKENETKNVNAIETVENYVKEHFSNPEISLAQMADMIYMNPNYLSRAFKKRTGKTFREYLFDLRMEEAFKLLRHTSLKSYEVAEKVGINDPGYFSTCFKKKFGISVQDMERR